MNQLARSIARASIRSGVRSSGLSTQTNSSHLLLNKLSATTLNGRNPNQSALRTAVRYYANDSPSKKNPSSPSSLLSDDILAKAGIDLDATKSQQEPSSSASSSSETTSSSAQPESESESPHTTEEQRQRWKGTAKKATNKTTTDLKREKHSNYFYVASFGLLVAGSVYFARDWDNEEERKRHSTIENGYTPELLWARFSARVGDLFGYFNEPVFEELLPDPLPAPYGRPFTLVVGLDDVLIHSEWSRNHGWRTAKRPGLDYFLGYLAQYYEVVVFSSNYMVHSEKIVPKLDPYRASISHALYREGTVYRDGKIIKDLSRLNRDLGKVIIIDCNPDAFSMQPDNAIPLKPWEGNANDKELVKLIPFLEWLATQPIKDVRPILHAFDGTYIPDEYARRESIARKKFEEEWYKEHKQRQKNDWASAFLGVKSPIPSAPMMPQDYIRQEGQKGYEQFQKYVQEHGEAFLAEEKAREQQIMNDQKFTLNKLVTQGLPKPEDIQAAALAAEQQQQSGSQ